MSSSTSIRSEIGTSPRMKSVAVRAPSSGGGRTSASLMSTTSETPSTTTPKSRRPPAETTDRTMMTVTEVYSARSSARRIRRSTIGTIEPRRLSTPSTCAGACGIFVTADQPRISCTRRMSTPYVSSPSTKVSTCRVAEAAASPNDGAVGGGVAAVIVGSSSSDAWVLLPACSCCRTKRGEPDEPWQVQNQRDRSISEDRRARDALDVSVVGLERLDDDLLLAEQIVDEQADAPALAFDDDDQTLVQLARARLDSEDLVQPDDWQILTPERKELAAAAEAVHLLGFQLQRFDDRGERDDIGFGAYGDRLAVHDREGKGQRDDETRASAAFGAHLDGAAELLDVAPDDVHSDAAAGEIRRLFGG